VIQFASIILLHAVWNHAGFRASRRECNYLWTD
jgi:hypothetical protein